MKRLFFFCVIMAFFLVGCVQSVLTVHTQPPGGMIKIENTKVTLRDGGSVKLKPGSYTLTSFKPGYTGESIKINISSKKNEVVTVPLGEPYAVVTLKTIPPGLKAEIIELARNIKDGDKIPLKRGQYTFVLKAPGYRETKSIVQVDGHTPQTVILQRGKGHGHICIRVIPSKASILLDDLPVVNGELEREIKAGKHFLEVRANGYFPYKKSFTIKPGKKLDLKIELKKMPDYTPVTFLTKPRGGAIYFQSKKIGITRAHLKAVKFGSYTVTAIKQVDKFHRITGSKKFRLSSPKPKQIKIFLAQKEYFYTGKWMPERKAKYLEEQSYLKHKVKNPVLVDVKLSGEAVKELLSDKELTLHLHRILRVGDCIRFNIGGKEYIVWKRHRNITPEFKYQIQVLKKGKTNVRFLFEPVKKKGLLLNIKNDPLSKIAFFLYRVITNYPLLNLKFSLLNRTKENVYRCKSDGVITVVMQGGKGVRINGKKAMYFAKDLCIQKIPEGNNTLKFIWQYPPKRILVVSYKKAVFINHLPANVILKRNEKKLLKLVDQSVKVRNIVRITCLPNNTIKKEFLTSTGPIKLDLNIDEVGPHDLAGNYTRIWIVRFMKNNELSQRQLSMRYQVINRIHQNFSGIFLRRKKMREK